MNASRCVFVLAGPSGGHLFPAWSFAESLRTKRLSCRIVLLTGERAKKLGTPLEQGPFDSVYYSKDFHGFSLNPWRFLGVLANAVVAFFQAWRWICREKPCLAAGFGSYVSCPGVVLAYCFKIPILLHEQNKIAGKATRFLLPLARELASSFEGTVPEPGRGKPWTVTGLPIQRPLIEAAANFERIYDKTCLTWLVVGGSQGALRLNALVLETIRLFSPEERGKIAVIHITGTQDFEKVTAAYHGLKISAQTYPFFDKMYELFAQADFALTRAGANTLFELALFGVPAMVIPYPHAGAHQKENAAAFVKQGALICEEESKMNPDYLLRLVQIFLKDSALRKNLSDKIRTLANPSAGERLAEMACAVVEAL